MSVNDNERVRYGATRRVPDECTSILLAREYTNKYMGGGEALIESNCLIARYGHEDII